MNKLITKYKMFFKYMIISILVSAINVLVYTLLVNLTKDKYIFSNVIAWIISTYINFEFNKKIVFESRTSKTKQIIHFYILRLTSLFIDTLVLQLCLKILFMNYIIAKIISNFSTTFNNYFISKYFIFNKE